jgi:spermidine/putrescine-binding protein
MKTNKGRGIWVIVLLICAISVAAYFITRPSQAQTLRLLAWVGYDEPDLLREFTEKTNIQVDVKTFIGGSAMLKLLEGSPAGYDVVVLDPEYIEIAASKGLIQPLNASQFDMSHFHPFFLESNLVSFNNLQYAVPVRFGTIGIMYNTDRVKSEELVSIEDLFKPMFRDKISVMSLWQPTMGVVSLSLSPQPVDPFHLSEQGLDQLNSKMQKLRQTGVRVHSTVPELIGNLTDERTWIMLGGGEANVPALQARNKRFACKIPKEGGILWMESVGITSRTKKKNEAEKLIRYLQSPTGQVRLARRSAYISSPPSITAVEMLDTNERELRGLSDRAAMDQLLSSVKVRRLPPEQDQNRWNTIWAEFLRPTEKQ